MAKLTFALVSLILCSVALVSSVSAQTSQEAQVRETVQAFYSAFSSRGTEWPVEFLSRPKRTPNTIPDFLAPDAPANRVEILRGTATRGAK